MAIPAERATGLPESPRLSIALPGLRPIHYHDSQGLTPLPIHFRPFEA